MSESEEWTVVSSKSRSKKVGSLVKEENRGSSLQKNQERYNQSQKACSGKASSLSSNRAKNHESVQQSGASNVSQNPPTPKKRPPGPSYKTMKSTTIKGRISSTPVVLVSPVRSTELSVNITPNLGESSNKSQTLTKPQPSTSACSSVSASKSTPKPKNISTNVPKLENAASVPATVTSTTKKKRPSKENRRKKREEKFYQALYQNKDSHIQFVSADVIRRIQNDSKVPSSKPSSSKNLSSCSSTQPTPGPSFQNSQLTQSFDDFPSLSPACSHEIKSENKLNRISESSANVVEDSISTPKVSTCETQRERDRQLWISPKCLDDAFQATTPVDKEKSICAPTPSTATASSKGKKSKQPMIIDVSSLIVSKKKERDLQRKLPSSSTPYGRPLKKENFKITAGNPLDSSGPGVINRGKIRQKKKKPTKLKLSILKSRALKKILLEGKIRQTVENTEENSIDSKGAATVETVSDAEVTLAAEKNESENVSNEQSQSPLKVDVKLESIVDNYVETADVSQHVDVKNDETLDKINTISDNDFSLKFIKLLDEVSMLKIVDDTLSPEIEVAVKSSMHNRKFRDYCDMYTSKELHRLVMSLLSELFRFQDRLYHTDPIKFKTKRRLVSGLKEALCYLNLNKVQLLIIAPDIEKNPEPGGLDDKITQILTLAKGKGVPYIFSGTKYNLGKPLKIKTPLSIVSILDKQNCEETFRALLEETNQLREKYHNDFAMKVKELKGLKK